MATEDGGGPWGSGGDVFLSLLPLIFLVSVTVIPKITIDTSKSLPLGALMLWFIRLAYFSSPAAIVNALVLSGLLEALTPLSIILGAVVLFESAEATGCLAWIMRLIRKLTGHRRVAEIFLIGWSFPYMVEGASGFGTPAALAAPMLVSLGYPPVPAIACLLITNTLATPFGAVGTPIWFGLDGLGLSDEDLRLVGRKVAFITGIISYILVPFAASFLVSWRELREAWLFVLLSITSAVLPSIGLSFVSVEFPSLLAGIISLVITGALSQFGIGLPSPSNPSPSREDKTNVAELPVIVEDGEDTAAANGGNVQDERINNHFDDPLPVRPQRRTIGFAAGEALVSRIRRVVLETAEDGGENGVEENDGASPSRFAGVLDALGRTFPWWATVLVLAITRIPQLKIKGALQTTDHSFNAYLGTFGIFSLNPSLVFRLRSIFATSVGWTYALLYVPFILPFVLVSGITVFIYRKDLKVAWWVPFTKALLRVKDVAVALFGALVLVQLFRQGGGEGVVSPAVLVGINLADWLRDGFIAFSALLGIIGSFFSGSTTVSNLTFGEVQTSAAEGIDRSVTAMLALQTAGATAGNCVCINNILAAKAVVGVKENEGAFIRRTAPAAFLFWILATLVSLVFLLGDVWPDDFATSS